MSSASGQVVIDNISIRVNTLGKLSVDCISFTRISCEPMLLHTFLLLVVFGFTLSLDHRSIQAYRRVLILIIRSQSLCLLWDSFDGRDSRNERVLIIVVDFPSSQIISVHLLLNSCHVAMCSHLRSDCHLLI